MSAGICRKYRVLGRVQGVFFRASTAEMARELGLTGHALNLADGSVEVLACGRPEKIEALSKWLQHGPRLAQVENVQSEIVQVETPTGFRTG